MPVLQSTTGNRPQIMPYVQQGQMVPMLRPQVDKTAAAAQIEQRLQPNQKPQAAMVNTGEEIIPADVVQSLGGSGAITEMLNKELGRRGLPPLVGDKGTVGAYAAGPAKQPNMACGTVGKSMMKNYAVGTVGTQDQTQPKTYTAADTAQGATNVLGTAQTKATTGFQSPTAAATSTATQELLKAPATDPNRVQAGLQAFDVNRAKAYEAYRQKTAPISNTAANRDEMLNLAMQGAVDRSVYENQLRSEQEATDWQRRLDAIAQGRATTGMEQANWAGDISNLVAVRGAGEGEAARTWQSAENTVARDWEMGKLVSIQDFDREMKQIDADLAKALQSGDIQAQKDLLDKRAYYDAQAAQVAQAWQTAERVATQAWQTGERIGEQDFTAGQAYLDRQLQEAMQDKDILAQRTIEQMRTNLALQMQTQDMAQQEKMAYLGAQLAEAKANNDLGRQMQIIGFQTDQEIRTIKEQQGFEAAQADLDRRLEQAMQNKDIAAQYTLQQAQLRLEREQMAQDRTLEEARIALTARGLDMNAIENQYNMIQDAIQNGQAAPDAARTFLNDVLKTNGITLAAPDPLAEQKALLADWNNMQYQYALSHGETPGIVTTDENGNINGLTNAGAAEFSAWYNDNIYGNKNVDGYMSGEKPVTGIIGAPNSTDYLAVMSRATPFDPNSSPSKGQYISNNGVLYYVESDLTAGGSGGANFTVVDVSTGARGQLNPSSMTNGRYTGWTFNGFPTNQSTTTGAGGVTVLPPGSSGR